MDDVGSGAAAGSVRVSPDVQWTENEAAQVIVMDTVSGDLFGLVGSGGVAWRSLVESGSVDSASRTLAATYHIDHARAAADVQELVDDLVSRRLLWFAGTDAPDAPDIPDASRSADGTS